MARPTVFTKQILQKLDEAFALGCSDEEACFFADISPSSLYNFQNEKPEFLERKQQLKLKPILRARQIVIKAMEKNPSLAFKYLERKCRDEFGSDEKSIELSVYEGKKAHQYQELAEKINQMIENSRSPN